MSLPHRGDQDSKPTRHQNPGAFQTRNFCVPLPQSVASDLPSTANVANHVGWVNNLAGLGLAVTQLFDAIHLALPVLVDRDMKFDKSALR